jgi:hypothetical protein
MLKKTCSLALLFVAFPFLLFSQKKLKTEGEIPVLAWMGVPSGETSVERFQELKACGFNLNFVEYPNIPAVEKALDIAQKTGIRLVPSCPELKSDPEGTVKKLMHHPALAGYHLRDEPSRKDFPELGKWARRIQAVDKKHFCYLNLFPTYAGKEQLGTDSYREYVETFVKEIPVEFISYDNYPLAKNRVANKDYYENMEIIRAISEKNGLPFWAFGLSVAFDDYAIPTVGEIKYQVYSILAYGAQTVQYFTYWTPDSRTWAFHHAPIAVDGRRTQTYDRLQLINRELHALSGVFMGSKVLSVGHTGDHVPRGTTRLNRLPDPVKVLQTEGEGAVVSLLEKGDDQFLVIVNRDFKNPMRLTFSADERVERVMKDGTLLPAHLYANTMDIDPGDVAIYTWKKK